VAIRKHLEEVYAAHNPSKLDDIDTILRSFVGREEIMFHKLYAKYDITTPIPTSCTALVGGGEDTAMDGLDDTTHIRRSETLWLKTCVYLLGPAGQRDVVLASAASSPLSVSGDEAASVSAGPRTPAGPFGGGGGGDAALAEPWFQPFSRRALSSPTSPSLVVALASLLCMASETLVDVEQRALAGIGDDDDDDDDSSDDSGGDLGGGGSMGGAAVAAAAASRGGGGGRGGYRSSNGRRATIASSPLDDERDERAVRHCCNTLIGDIPRLIACLLDAARAGPQLHAGPARGLLRTVPVHLSRALHLTTHHLTDRAERQRLVVSTYTGYGGGEGEDAVAPPPMGLPPLCMAVPAMLPLINAIARFMGDPDQGVRSVASQCCALVLRHIIRSDEASRSVADDDARGRIPFSPLIAVQDTAWSTMEQVFASSLVDTYLGLPADQYVFSSPQMAALPHGLAPMGGGMRGGMRGGMGAGGDMGGRGAQIPQQGRRIYHPSAAFAAMANVLRLVSPTSYWIDNDGRVSSTAGGSGENERERRPPSKIDGLFQSWTHILAHCGALWRWRVAAAEVSAAIGHGESGSRLVPRRMSSTIGAPGIGSGLGSSSGAAAAHEDRALSACVALAGLFWQHRRPWHTVSMLRDAAALHGRVGGNSWCSGNCLALEALVLLNEVDWASDVSKTIALACGALEGSVLCYQMAGAWGDAAAAARSLVLCTAAQEENEAREAAIDGGLSMVGADAMAAAEALSSQLLQSPRIGSLLEQADGLAMRAAEAARGGGAATASEKNHTQASHSKPQFEYYAVLLFGTGFGRPSTRGQPPAASASQHGGASKGGPYGDQPGDRSGAETSGRPPLQALPLVPGLDDDTGATNGSMFMYRREMSGADDSHYNGGGANADDALRRVVHRLGHKYAATEAAEASVAGGMYGGGGGYGGGHGGMYGGGEQGGGVGTVRWVETDSGVPGVAPLVHVSPDSLLSPGRWIFVRKAEVLPLKGTPSTGSSSPSPTAFRLVDPGTGRASSMWQHVDEHTIQAHQLSFVVPSPFTLCQGRVYAAPRRTDELVLTGDVGGLGGVRMTGGGGVSGGNVGGGGGGGGSGGGGGVGEGVRGLPSSEVWNFPAAPLTVPRWWLDWEQVEWEDIHELAPLTAKSAAVMQEALAPLDRYKVVAQAERGGEMKTAAAGTSGTSGMNGGEVKEQQKQSAGAGDEQEGQSSFNPLLARRSATEKKVTRDSQPSASETATSSFNPLMDRAAKAAAAPSSPSTPSTPPSTPSMPPPARRPNPFGDGGGTTNPLARGGSGSGRGSMSVNPLAARKGAEGGSSSKASDLFGDSGGMTNPLAGGFVNPLMGGRRSQRGSKGAAGSGKKVRKKGAKVNVAATYTPVAISEDDGLAEASGEVRTAMEKLADMGVHMGPSDKKLLCGMLGEKKAKFEGSTITGEGLLTLAITLTPASMVIRVAGGGETKGGAGGEGAPMHTLAVGKELKIIETSTPYMMQVFAKELEDPLYLTCKKRTLLVAALKGFLL
jgi:hypothetical protein